MDRLPYNTVFDVRLKTLCHVGPWTVSFAAEVTVDMYWCLTGMYSVAAADDEINYM